MSTTLSPFLRPKPPRRSNQLPAPPKCDACPPCESHRALGASISALHWCCHSASGRYSLWVPQGGSAMRASARLTFVGLLCTLLLQGTLGTDGTHKPPPCLAGASIAVTGPHTRSSPVAATPFRGGGTNSMMQCCICEVLGRRAVFCCSSLGGAWGACLTS